MRRRWIATLWGLALLFAGAVCAPVWALGPPVVAGEPVHFFDRSIFGPESWSWDFDYDGVTPKVDSVEQNPVWVFLQPRTFQVRLEVCGVLGCNAVVRQVEVLEPPPIFIDGFEAGDLSRWNAASP